VRGPAGKGGAISPAPPGAPLTIAHVTGERGFSGGEVQVFLLIEGLRKLGHRNVLLCPESSRSCEESRRRGIEARPIRAGSEWSPQSVLRIRRELRALAPDVVHLHSGHANWLGGLAARQLRLPALTTRRMDRPVKRNLRTRYFYGSCVRRAVAISTSVARQLLAGGVPEAMVRVVRSAVDPGALHPQRSREATRAAEGLDAASPLLLAAAALVRRKGLDVLLRALAALGGRGLEPALWIAGEGPERASLERLARGLGLGSRVRFLGQRRDVPDLLLACDVFVLPSLREGLGVAALEAMVLGRPVVASRAGGLREAVDHERTGLLVPPGDPRALADALARLLEAPELRRRLGEAGPRWVAREFPLSEMVDAYERLYRHVVAEGSGG
jgi:glycosyltransferase involved in cell wall biosynthesis